MLKFKRADHIHICVSEERLEEARNFYTNIVGLTEIERPDELNVLNNGIWYSLADIELHVGVEIPAERTIRHTAFEVEDVAAARQYIESKGIEIVEEPFIPGRVRFAFIDPFGNRMELLEKVK